MQRHEDADAVIKYRSDKFKRIYGNDYVNPFVNPRYKDLFRVFESIVEFVDVRADVKENGDPIIVMEPIDVDKYIKKYRELSDFPFGSDESMMKFLTISHDRGMEKMIDVVKKIEKYNLSHSELSCLPYVE